MLADEIRDFAFRTNISPARRDGMKTASINAGAIHDAMGVKQRMPAVCGALGTIKFQRDHNIRLVQRTGPNQGASATFIFEV